jgi:hypothetical protein
MKDIKITTASLLTGFSIIGDTSNWPAILLGEFDFYIKIVIFNSTNERLPSELEISSLENESNLIDFKNSMRKKIQNEINVLSNNLKADGDNKKKENIKNASIIMKKINKPHEMGSVKEIAKKYNVSISKVRQLKKENKLHDLENPA